MNLHHLTIRAKLSIALAFMLLLVIGPLWVYRQQAQQVHQRLDEVFDLYNRKFEIGAQLELATTEMQGSQRGLMLATAMKDPAAAEPYKKLYATSEQKIDGLLSELRPLLSNSAERKAAAAMASDIADWAPRFQKLIELCDAGQIEQAYQLRNENKIISAEMHASATDLLNQQRQALKRAQSDSEAATARANTVAICITLLCLALSGLLSVGVRGLLRALRLVMTDLHLSAQEVGKASHHVASSSQIVAQGASQQAASVQETSSSADEITERARQHAGQLRTISGLTVSAADSVNHANRALSEMQASMHQINASCQQVGKIIRVIDEIAFQTNILALNAAVEAARAGESGMGFAVVADEVRNLAQRSAQAATETALLIEESLGKSQEGGAKLANVSQAMDQVTGSARQIAALVSEVESGGADQTRGIQQISAAMLRIGAITQSSASTAQQTSTVSEDLKSQAATLGGIVERLDVLVG